MIDSVLGDDVFGAGVERRDVPGAVEVAQVPPAFSFAGHEAQRLEGELPERIPQLIDNGFTAARITAAAQREERPIAVVRFVG